MLQKWFTAIYERQWRVVMSGILLVALPVILFVACAITPFIYQDKYYAFTAGMTYEEMLSITGLYGRTLYDGMLIWGWLVSFIGLIALMYGIFYGFCELYKTLRKIFTNYQPRKAKEDFVLPSRLSEDTLLVLDFSCDESDLKQAKK